MAAAAAAKSLQLCPTLCDPIDGSPPGSPIPGILQARTLEWVAFSFSNAWKWKVKVKSLSHVWPSATPWTAAFQAPPSMGFSRQEYWSGVPLPSPSDLLRKVMSAELCCNAWNSHLMMRTFIPCTLRDLAIFSAFNCNTFQVMVILVCHSSKMKSGFIHTASSYRLYEAHGCCFKRKYGEGGSCSVLTSLFWN